MADFTKKCVSFSSGDDDKKRNSVTEDTTVSNSNVESGEAEKVPYPKSVFFILSTEACERFSYYGMRGQ